MSARAHTQVTVQITQTKIGTYTLTLHRPDRFPERWRTGIPDEAEARQRAGTLASLCGYRVNPNIHRP